MFTAFVTKNELAAYMSKDSTLLPDNTEILIQRASELIKMSMRNNYNPSNSSHVEVVKLATCAQVQDWIEREVSAIASDNISGYSLGELSISYANQDLVHNMINLLACRYLNSECLLYKGLR